MDENDIILLSYELRKITSLLEEIKDLLEDEKLIRESKLPRSI